MKLYAVFSRGVPRQLPHSPHPISTTDSMAFCQNTKISQHTLISFTAHSLGNPALGPRIHNEALFDLPCLTSLTFSINILKANMAFLA